MFHGDNMTQGLKESLKECGALMFGTFTLASGEESNYYIDIKKASTDPEVLGEIAKGLASLIKGKDLRCDRLAGVVLGSIPIVVALSLETGIPYVMVRKARKEHGTAKAIEGTLNRGERVIVVEDVVTSALSASEAVMTLRDQGALVEDVIAVVDRQGGGKERLEGMGLSFHPLLTADQLLEE
jgi:orotate phosphoribosyltransferase